MREPPPVACCIEDCTRSTGVTLGDLAVVGKSMLSNSMAGFSGAVRREALRARHV